MSLNSPTNWNVSGNESRNSMHCHYTTSFTSRRCLGTGVVIGSCQLDIIVQSATKPIAGKSDCRTHVRLGGGGGNALRALCQMGMQTTLISSQHATVRGVLEQMVRQECGRCLLGTSSQPGVTVALPHSDEPLLYAQRADGFTPELLTPQARCLIGSSQILLLAPLRPDPPVLRLFQLAAAELRQPGAAVGLVLHPAWFNHPLLKELFEVVRPSYLQVNAAEARHGLGAGRLTSTKDLAVGLAEWLQTSAEIAVTNAGQEGSLWSPSGVKVISPNPLRGLGSEKQVGAGDVFAAAYMASRYGVEEASTELAVHTAVKAAARWIATGCIRGEHNQAHGQYTQSLMEAA